MTKPRAYTKKEARDKFLRQVATLARYWATLPGDQTILERCNGVAFSILTLIDGETLELPAINLSLSPHPDDQEFHKSEGENWFADQMVINDDVHLHELFVKYEKQNN